MNLKPKGINLHRKQIKVILDNLVGLNKDLVLSFTEKYVINTLPQWRFISFADVEVAIALVYYIGEALPNSGGNHFTGGEVKPSNYLEFPN